MTKAATVKKSILSAMTAAVLAFALSPISLIPAAATPAFADEPPAATQEDPISVFTDSIEHIIRTESFKVYAATARASGDEAEARAIEAAANVVAETVPIAVEVPSASAPIVTALVEPAASDDPAAVAPADPDVSPESAAEPALVAPLPNTIRVGASVIPFVQCYLATEAPATTAGLWWGASSTTDGGLGYFVGHNPGVFAPVVALSVGDSVTVIDESGATCVYTVIDVFDVENTMTLEEVQPRICGHGESIAMQACVQNGDFYRIVVAAA